MEKIQQFSTYLIGATVLIIILLIPGLFIWGSIKLGELIISWLYVFSKILFCFNLLILAPMAIIPKFREWAGIGMYLSSYIFGITLWFLSLLFTYTLWGWIAVFIGLFIAGIGIVPIAYVIVLLKGLWVPLGYLVILTILTFGTRIGGLILCKEEF